MVPKNVNPLFKLLVDKYMKSLNRFRSYVLARRERISAMRLAAVEKMFYGLGDEARSKPKQRCAT